MKKAALHAQLESNRKQSGTLHWVWQSWLYVSYLFVLSKKQNTFFLILEHVYLLRTQNLTAISTNASPISCPSIWSTVCLFEIVHVCMCSTHCVVDCVFVCICAYIRAGLQIEKWQMNYCHTKVWYPNVYSYDIYLSKKFWGDLPRGLKYLWPPLLLKNVLFRLQASWYSKRPAQAHGFSTKISFENIDPVPRDQPKCVQRGCCIMSPVVC